MSNTNYVILTVASVDFSYRETMARLMSSYSKDLIDNAGAKGTRFGSIGTGDHAGSLIFIQFYDDLTGYQKALEIQSKSSVFKEIMDSGKANIYLRNISTSLPSSNILFITFSILKILGKRISSNLCAMIFSTFGTLTKFDHIAKKNISQRFKYKINFRKIRQKRKKRYT